MKKLRERLNIFAVKNPSQAILIMIMVLNLALFAVAGLVISLLAPRTLEHSGFWDSVFYTISMIFDAGCIQYVIADIGEASVALIIVCLATVVLGMITFTGAVIGYVTNYISNYIANSKSGVRALKISEHTVILNWNSRASEIINDLLYTNERETVVILVSDNAAAVEREIGERISATLKADQEQLAAETKDMGRLKGWLYRRKNRTRNRVTVIVREGDTYSTKHLNDISISQADTVILLSKDVENELCRFGNRERQEAKRNGNANTVKTLMQVAQMTADLSSADNQTIIVEVEDEWTAKLVQQIISHKERAGKCTIIPVMVHTVLGQLLSQFSIMPELNMVYSELFSNRGAEFFYQEHPWKEDVDGDIRRYMSTHHSAIPLTLQKTRSGCFAYYVANSLTDCGKEQPAAPLDFRVSVNPDYQLSRRNIVIVGHNSKSRDIMKGFDAFRGEHHEDEQILNITVVDDPKSLEQLNNYSGYPYVTRTRSADVHDEDTIKDVIREAIDSFDGDTSILILSDDAVPSEDIDAAALTYLIYVQAIIQEKISANPDFDTDSIDVVVEILNPKNYDVVHNYSVNNVVISNRYISKMVTQIGRKQPLFDFYCDILTFDEEDAVKYVSKELYIKEVEHFFLDGAVPGPCTAEQLIRAVYDSSPENNKAVVLGYVCPGGKMVIFSGDQSKIPVSLSDKDKLIIFSNH